VDELLELSDFFFKIASSPEYMKQYMANRYHNVRNKIINDLGGKCNKCGITNVPFEIDHIDSSKKTFRAADAHSVSEERLNKELPNLQLLCNPCHKEKTKESWDYGTNKPSHGTYWMYRKYKCRCNECTIAYKEKKKEWNSKGLG
jgi:5-methylcytosine-specific restriction endonuclease McrA